MPKPSGVCASADRQGAPGSRGAPQRADDHGEQDDEAARAAGATRAAHRERITQCADVGASARFYDEVLAPLGGQRVMDFGVTIGYGPPSKPEFWIGSRETGEGFRESHIAFAAPDRGAVRAFYDAAVARGAQVLHQPRLWPEYHPSYFAAYVRDPDGNNVEAVCHQVE